MNSDSSSAERAIHSLDKLVLSIDISNALPNLHLIYDAFIKDRTTGDLTHEERLEVHSTYRALQIFMQELLDG